MDYHGKPIVWVCPKMGDIQTIAIVEANQNEQDYTIYFLFELQMMRFPNLSWGIIFIE